MQNLVASLVKGLVYLQNLVAYLGGSAETPPDSFPLNPGSWLWGLWWGILLIVALTFCGQSSKFIYIDF